jgi:TatA/E family protein of Tat protein translocase
MLNLDPAKLLVIAVVAVILLGPDRLPQVARQLGGAWRSFNEYRHRMENEVRSSMPDLPSTTEIARLARSPSALLNHLSNMSSDTNGTLGTATPTRGEHLGSATFATAAPMEPMSTDADSPPHMTQDRSAQPAEVDAGDPSMN